MSKVASEVKAITDAKWIKNLEELDTIRDITWTNIDIDITIQELVVEIKALPAVDSD